VIGPKFSLSLWCLSCDCSIYIGVNFVFFYLECVKTYYEHINPSVKLLHLFAHVMVCVDVLVSHVMVCVHVLVSHVMVCVHVL
jgi:hypothetical protein